MATSAASPSRSVPRWEVARSMGRTIARAAGEANAGRRRLCQDLYMMSMISYATGMKATVSSKGQVTIPKALRDALGLSEGTVLDFREEAGRLVAQKADPRDRVAEVYGILGDGRTSDDVLADLRGYEPDPAA
ncbi:MAG: hypothetical protein CVU56_19235 [Deltaproteobacteria bacterium HGW-Deltaproteobacteria-14]|nr:MAG: hypothetical protein CVU56_19235 [Deltaproteobacteria bacterium HGW-Deltaproteobacteria-14]